MKPSEGAALYEASERSLYTAFVRWYAARIVYSYRLDCSRYSFGVKMDESTRWSSEKCLKLIDQFEKHPILWNPEHDLYHNKTKRNDAWVIIDGIMKCAKGESKMKMLSVLSSFRMEKVKGKKLIEIDKSKYEIYVSKWFAFSRMAFLLDIVDSVLVQSFLDDAFEEIFGNEISQKDGANSVNIEVDESTTEDLETRVLNNTPHSTQKHGETIMRRKKAAKLEEEKKITEAFDMVKGAVGNSELKTDESDVYGQYVAHKLRSYTKKTRDIVEHHINITLFNADMGGYD